MAWHGVLNFGSGAVNGASGLVNGLTAMVNWGNNVRAGGSLCVDVPETPAIPQIGVWGDPDLYGASQLSGQVTSIEAGTVATAGVGGVTEDVT